MSWETDTCQYCGNSFHLKNLSSHESYCTKNPANEGD